MSMVKMLLNEIADIRDSIKAARTDEHDWTAYDSSDIHLRTQEWETQAQPVAVQHFAPTRKPITAAQREQANAALATVMPGVQLGENMRQRKAHEILVSFLGVDAANLILAGE